MLKKNPWCGENFLSSCAHSLVVHTKTSTVKYPFPFIRQSLLLFRALFAARIQLVFILNVHISFVITAAVEPRVIQAFRRRECAQTRRQSRKRVLRVSKHRTTRRPQEARKRSRVEGRQRPQACDANTEVALPRRRRGRAAGAWRPEGCVREDPVKYRESQATLQVDTAGIGSQASRRLVISQY